MNKSELEHWKHWDIALLGLTSAEDYPLLIGKMKTPDGERRLEQHLKEGTNYTYGHNNQAVDGQ